MGKISNDATEKLTDASSQIEVLFDVLALPHDGYVAGNLYRVSVGAMYQSESYVTVAQDDLTYADYTEKVCLYDYSLCVCVVFSLLTLCDA